MEYGQNERNLGEIILEIKKSYGEDILRDTARLNALLMDYAPDMAKERKLVINALKEGIMSRIDKSFEESGDDEAVLRRCVAFLVEEMWITKDAAQYVMSVIFSALGRGTSVLAGNEKTGDIEEDNGEQLIKGQASFGPVVNGGELSKYKSIGYKAFAANEQLVEITIPEGVTEIYPKAFLNCSSLKRVILSRSIRAIGRSAFDGCTSLETIKAENNPVFTVSNGLLIDKAQKKLIKSTAANGSRVQITNGVKTICGKAFEKVRAVEVIIPESVEKIEEDAFYMTLNLQKIEADPANRQYKSIDGVLHSRDGKALLRYPQGKTDIAYYLEDAVTTIGRKAFSCAKNLTSVTFAGQVREIGENAFEYCMGIENLMLPRSVESIGERAFQYCEKITSVMLPQGIIRVGDCAFLGCTRLRTISVPKTVTEIGNMAFAACRSLTKVVIQENVRFIGDRAFSGCPDVVVLIRGNEYAEAYCKAHNIKYAGSLFG